MDILKTIVAASLAIAAVGLVVTQSAGTSTVVNAFGGQYTQLIKQLQTG